MRNDLVCREYWLGNTCPEVVLNAASELGCSFFDHDRSMHIQLEFETDADMVAFRMAFPECHGQGDRALVMEGTQRETMQEVLQQLDLMDRVNVIEGLRIVLPSDRDFDHFEAAMQELLSNPRGQRE